MMRRKLGDSLRGRARFGSMSLAASALPGLGAARLEVTVAKHRSALLACLAGLAACHGEEPRREPGELRVQLNADIVSADPGMRRDLNTDSVLLQVAEGLLSTGEDGSAAPMLAKSWTVSPDGRVYTFALRRGVLFHNGNPFTSAAVLWSYKRYFAPHSTWRCRSEFGPRGMTNIASMSAPDPYTFRLVLTRRAPLLLKTLARIDCGSTAILDPASLAPDGAIHRPIGTGPFEWGEWRHNQFIELKRFAGYAPLPGPPDGTGGGKEALVERLRFTIIPDSSSAAAALLRGSIDILDGVGTGERGALAADPHVALVESPVTDFYGILFQAKSGPLADPRMRRAIAASLDVSALARVATRGTGDASSSPISPASPYARASERRLVARDLPLARRLAHEAGYRGEALPLIASHSPPEMFDAALIVQDMARDAGIRFEVVSLDWASQLALYSAGDYQAMVFGYSARTDPSTMYSVFTGSRSSDPRKVWDAPEARKLLQQSQDVSDPKERQPVFDRLETLFRQQAPAIVLYSTRRVAAVRDDVHGFRPWPAQAMRLWNVRKEAR